MKYQTLDAPYKSKSDKPSVRRVFHSEKPHRISRRCQSLSMRGSETTVSELQGKVGIGQKQPDKSEGRAFVTAGMLTKSTRAQRKNEAPFEELLRQILQSTSWRVIALKCWLNARIGVTTLPTRCLEKSKNS